MPKETTPDPIKMRKRAAELREMALASKDPELRREYWELAAEMDKIADALERDG
jgi:hypothetical protein